MAVLALLLLGGFFFLTTKAVDMTLFCNRGSLRTEDEAVELIHLDHGVVIDQPFTMPYERFFSIAPVFVCEDECNGIVWIELLDQHGNVVYSKQMLAEYVKHVFETAEAESLIDVNNEELYTLRLWSDCDDTSGVSVKVTSDVSDTGESLLINGNESGQQVYFGIMGGYKGQADKSGFAIFYLLFSVLVLYCVESVLSKKVSLDYDRIELVDKILIAVLVVYCALYISEANDIQVIVRGSYHLIDSIKDGQLGDFYTYAYQKELEAGTFGRWAFNYNILQYAFIAPFVLPFKNALPSFSHYYFEYLQILIAGLMMYSVHLIKKMVHEFKLDKSFERTVPFLFLTSGMAFFSSVGFGQFDVVFLICVLWGLRFYAQKKYYRFSLCMSFAIAFKTFPIMLLIPMILLTHKKVKDIVAHIAVGMSVSLLTGLIYNGTEGYKIMMKLVDNEQYFIDKITFSRIENGGLYGGMFGISLFILMYVLICAFAYMIDVDRDDYKSVYTYIALIGFLVYVDLFCFLIWHIAWLLPMALFTSMLIPLYSKTQKLMVFNFVMELAALLTAWRWNQPSISMLNYGLLTDPFGSNEYYRGASFGTISYNISSVTADLYFALMVGVLLFLSFYFIKATPAMLASRKQNEPCVPVSRVWAWARIGTVLGYGMLSLFCFYYLG